MKRLITIIILLLAVLSSYGQRNRTFDRLTVRDSIIFTDTTEVINLPSVPNADTAGTAQKLEPVDSVDANWILTDSLRSNTNLRQSTDFLIKPPHGWAEFQDSSITISVTQNVYSQITNVSDSLFRVFEEYELIISGDTVTVNDKAHFITLFSVGFEGTLNDEYTVRINSTNGVLNKGKITAEGNGNQHIVPVMAYWNADVGDQIWFEITNNSSGDDPVITEGTLIIWYFHPIY